MKAQFYFWPGSTVSEPKASLFETGGQKIQHERHSNKAFRITANLGHQLLEYFFSRVAGAGSGGVATTFGGGVGGGTIGGGARAGIGASSAAIGGGWGGVAGAGSAAIGGAAARVRGRAP